MKLYTADFLVVARCRRRCRETCLASDLHKDVRSGAVPATGEALRTTDPPGPPKDRI